MKSVARRSLAGLCVTLLSFACLAGDVPDLTKGEGPDITKVDNGTYSSTSWILHFHGIRGWMYKDKLGKSDKAKQILITKIYDDSRIADQIKVGDVILGVNGKPFTGLAVFEFRKAARTARTNETGLPVILWRKEWGKSRNVTLTPKKLETDFTKGAKPDFSKGVDWNLGATGARGWMQAKFHDFYRARQIYITKVHKGSPADGVLEVGDVVLGIGEKKFSTDARKAFGKALTQAETRESKGQLTLFRWRNKKTDTVTLQLDVLGAYSKTTPWGCEKSQKILDRACGYLVKNGTPRHGINTGPAIVRSLALMSTGNKNFMPIVREHVDQLIAMIEKNMAAGKQLPSWGYPSWGWGYINLFMTEYHLLTKDERVLPYIKEYCEAIARGQSGVGSWGHGMAWPDQPMNRGKIHGALGGYGAVNQAGNVCWISLMLGKRCGVKSAEVDQAIKRGHRYLKSFVDLQTIGYGDHFSFDTTKHENNGLNSSAAVGFALYGDRHGTDYYSRMTVASHAAREEGHTGVWFAFTWAALGANRAGQEGCSGFLHELTWLYDLERRWDGGFVYQGKPGFGTKLTESGPRKGMQQGNAEHQYAYWDTTGGRILMYCLPRKVLYITGKDEFTAEVPANEVPAIVDAGIIPGAKKELASKYDTHSEKQLLELLGNWSPVVRTLAAKSLAKKKAPPIDEIVAMLESENRYARYGACTALRTIKPKQERVINGLIKQLNADDVLVQMHAALALGFIGDKRATEPLLKMAATEYPKDQRGSIPRTLCVALFQSSPYKEDKGLLAKSIKGVDDELLIPALRKLLHCPGGASRSMLSQAVTDLTPAQRDKLWPDLVFALREVAPSGIMFADGIRKAIAGVLAENKIEEGMDLIVEYLHVQKGHGKPPRTKKILPLLKHYGIHARRIVPQLEAYLKEEKAKKRPNAEVVAAYEETIKAIKLTEKKVNLTSIKKHLK